MDHAPEHDCAGNELNVTYDSARVNTEELLREIDLQRALMIAVSTGGHAPRIGDVNDQYTHRRRAIGQELHRRGVPDPNPYDDLWGWYGKYHGDLPRYQDRRDFVSSLYRPLLDQLTSAVHTRQGVIGEPTGWLRVDRDISDLQQALQAARTEPEFQSVGLRCREILISLAQAVFIREVHQVPPEVNVSDTDAKRQLDAYIAIGLSGASNEAIRNTRRRLLT
jgi:hypothetical protein